MSLRRYLIECARADLRDGWSRAELPETIRAELRRLGLILTEQQKRWAVEDVLGAIPYA